MAEVWGEWAQVDPGVATLTALYTVPAATQLVAVVTACNRGAATAIRVSVAIAGAADALTQYKAYDLPIGANNTLQIPIVAGATDVIRVYATLGTLTFTIAGVKIT
jgi:hypothetical protein